MIPVGYFEVYHFILLNYIVHVRASNKQYRIPGETAFRIGTGDDPTLAQLPNTFFWNTSS